MDELIPTDRAQIEWSENDSRQVAEVLVFDRANPPNRRGQRAKYENSNGACIMGWLTSGDARQTPEGVFVEMARDGFANSDALLQALQEFGKMNRCDWARTMAEALELRIENERQSY